MSILNSGQSETIRVLREEIVARDLRIQSLQARIDSLMLEYCPDEMTPEQLEKWRRHQVPVERSASSGEG